MDFQAAYDRSTYLRWFGASFLPDDFSAKTESVSLSFSAKYIQEALFLGRCESLDLPVYEIHHHSENDPRVSLAKETFHLLAEYLVRNALVVFVSSNSENYRLSYISIDLKIVDGKIQKEFTNPRRYSFFLGPNCKTHTPSEFLLKKGRIKSLEDLQERFSVEVVNKEFYNEIALLFTRLVGGSRKIGSKTIDEKGLLQLPSLPNNEQNHQKYQEFAVRLLGRLVFCWFLQKKSSPSGVSLISEDLLSSQAVGENEHYYHNILEHLFFQVLNTPQDERNEVVKDRFQDTPFLNGGLFEPHEDDYYYPDPVMRITRYLNNLIIPDIWFLELFTIFETYNFTIDENTTIDIELSIDPEMLGRIFENLLAEINPETGETARKSTGSYYTPRSIVAYMVDESLKQYLKSKTGLNDDILNPLLSYSEDIEIKADDRQSIIQALDEIKVLDPACGSGAFPMGILQKMLLILQKVDPNANEWQRRTLDSFPDPLFREIVAQKFAYDHDLWDYSRKLGIIRKSIYGVDIQAIAIEISKLRVFLSLIVDEKVDDEKSNRGIEHLPNLEFKFVAANTLIALPKGQNISAGESEEKIGQLKQLRDAYFISYGSQKKKIERIFKQVQKEMAEGILSWGETDSVTYKLICWEPFSYNSAEFFDPHWMFGVVNGFDIVIGNPPYDVYQGYRKNEIEIVKKLPIYEIAKGGKLNAYKLFLARSSELLGKNGITCQIFQNSFLGDLSAQNLRLYYLANHSIRFIDSFPERDDINKRVFPGVKMSICIMLAASDQDPNNCFRLSIYSDRQFTLKSSINYTFKDIKEIDPDYCTILSIDASEKSIIKKIALNKRLKNFGKCYEGEINLTFHKKYLSLSKNSGFVPMIKGAAVQRYYLAANMSQGDLEWVDQNSFLNENFGQKTKHHFQERLVMQGITGVDESQRLKMTLLPKGVFCGNSVNYILFDSGSLQKEYFLALLNSSLLNWYFKKFSTNSNVNGYEVDMLPIVFNDMAQKYTGIISMIVDYLIYLKNKEQKVISQMAMHLNKLINAIVYELYFPEQIKDANAEVLKLLINLQEIDNDWSDQKNLENIEMLLQQNADPHHPVSIAIEQQKNVTEVRIIEKLNK